MNTTAKRHKRNQKKKACLLQFPSPPPFSPVCEKEIQDRAGAKKRGSPNIEEGRAKKENKDDEEALFLLFSSLFSLLPHFFPFLFGKNCLTRDPGYYLTFLSNVFSSSRITQGVPVCEKKKKKKKKKKRGKRGKGKGRKGRDNGEKRRRFE